MAITDQLRSLIENLTVRRVKKDKTVRHDIEKILINFEEIFTGYVRIASELTPLTKNAEQKDCLSMVRDHFIKASHSITRDIDLVVDFVEQSFPVLLSGDCWSRCITSYVNQLTKVIEAFEPLLLCSSDRHIIEIVRDTIAKIYVVCEQLQGLLDRANTFVEKRREFFKMLSVRKLKSKRWEQWSSM